MEEAIDFKKFPQWWNDSPRKPSDDRLRKFVDNFCKELQYLLNKQ